MSGSASEVFDEIGLHLEHARSIDRAVVPLGMYLAWCANHQLLSDALSERAAGLVMRVRFREVTGGELAVAGCAGRLAAEHLNDEGRAFTGHYYPRYFDEFRAVFGADAYAIKDDWDNYDRIAPRLTRALMRFRGWKPAADRSAADAAADSAIGAATEIKPARWKFWK